MKYWILLLLFIQVQRIKSVSLDYDVNNNYYDGLLISISPDVPDPGDGINQMVENIEKWVTEGSKNLFSASQGWAYFNNVYILLPTSWASYPNATAATDVHEDAQIRVEPTHAIYGDSPFTLQTGECGDQGDYIQVSTNFITQQIPDDNSVFGPPGQSFLYEWSKFRYGVFEEHGYPGDPLFPMFYKRTIYTADGEKTEVKPNFCTNEAVEGTMERMSGESCSFDSLTLMPEDDCFFAVNGPSTLKSSVMGVPYFPGNDQWCDITEERQHHSEIPTKHNTMCDGLSVFEVVRKNPDFAEFEPKNNETNTTPKFTILQPESSVQPYVFVLDYSNSMVRKDNGRLAAMKQSIKRFLTYDVDMDLGLPVGVVRFSAIADTIIAENITKVDSKDARDHIINTVNDMKNTGQTCLQTGIQKGLQALREFDTPTGGAAIFITDGGQYCGNGGNFEKDWLSVIIDDVLAQNVRFCTIALSNAADPKLEELAVRTNGASYFVRDHSGPEGLNNALAGCLQFLPSTPSQSQEIFQKSYINTNSLIIESFSIDQYSGTDMKLQVDFDISGTYMLTTSIDNQYWGLKDVDVVELSYPPVETGTYTVTLTPESNAKINSATILIKSKSADDIEPLVAKCWSSSGSEDLQLSGENPDKLVLFGQVMQGMNPVIDAGIVAMVTSDENEEESVTLKDDGIAPDLIKNDGIYSAYHIVPNEDGKHRYSLVCKVAGDDQTLVVDPTVTSKGKSLPSHPSASAPLCCGSVAVKDDTPLSPTGNFTRSKPGGVITVQGDGKGDNLYPPGPIRDLILTDIPENSTFTLSFTFPGEDLNDGKVKEYFIFYSINRTDVQDLNPNSDVDYITEDMLDCDCTLEPEPAFTNSNLYINGSYFELGMEYNFRVLAVDGGGKTSASNVVAFVPSPKSPVQNSGDGLTWGIAIAIVFGAFGGTMLIAGAVFWHKWYYKW